MSDWSVCRVLTINLAMAGLQFCFACFCVLNNPFLHELKISATITAAISVIGPVCGFFVQPIIGYLSDRSLNKMGRRRPFLIFGAVATSISIIWMGMSAKIAGFFFRVGSDNYFTFAQVWAVFGVIFCNTFINVELAAFRSLIADCVPPEAQNKGAAYSGFMMGGSFLLCNVIMLVMYELNNDIKYADIYPIISCIAASTTLLLAIPSLIIAKEQPYDVSAVFASENAFKQLYREFKNMNKIFYAVMMPLLLGWIGYTPLQQFTGTIFSMDTTFIAQICLNGVTTVIAPVFGQFIGILGEKLIFFICSCIYILASALLILSGYFPTSFIGSQWFVSLCMALIGFVNCAMNTIPFIYVGKLAPAQSKGLYSGIFNSVIVIGQAIANIILTIVNLIVDSKKNPIWIAGVFSVITTISTLFLIDSSKCFSDKLIEETEAIAGREEI
ncbi:Major_facilitator superfamily protein [Hexamita inflata]|uniref:Major facilitator superfamily protein n=1 Tax=Hexamita inflata TaxID=28002 RepID=A0AA86VTA6_9EUKA|nr:Major facilitator superfamily protein [Hexamita inflata]